MSLSLTRQHCVLHLSTTALLFSVLCSDVLFFVCIVYLTCWNNSQFPRRLKSWRDWRTTQGTHPSCHSLALSDAHTHTDRHTHKYTCIYMQGNKHIFMELPAKSTSCVINTVIRPSCPPCPALDLNVYKMPFFFCLHPLRFKIRVSTNSNRSNVYLPAASNLHLTFCSLLPRFKFSFKLYVSF